MTADGHLIDIDEIFQRQIQSVQVDYLSDVRDRSLLFYLACNYCGTREDAMRYVVLTIQYDEKHISNWGSHSCVKCASRLQKYRDDFYATDIKEPEE